MSGRGPEGHAGEPPPVRPEELTAEGGASGASPGRPAESPAGGGTVHPGRPPRLRRVGRTAAVVVAVGFLGVLAVLTARYSHDFSRERAEAEEARPPSRTAPLSAERIEEYARERLREELQARKPPPAPPDLELPEEWGLGEEELGGSPPPSWAPPSPPPSPPPAPQRLSAIGSALSPAGSAGSAVGSGSFAGAGLPRGSFPDREERPDVAAPLEALRRRVERVLPGGGGVSPLEVRHREAEPGSSGAAGARLDLPTLAGHRLEPRSAGSGSVGPPRLAAGVVVPLVLTHDIGTDVPGPVRAWVARDVYDSESHSVVVIPRGTEVFGSQAARATVGDRRVLLVWRRLRLPSGVVYELPELPAGSVDGTAGARAEVDNHWWARFGNAVALSLVGAGVQLSQPQERTAVQGFAPDGGQVAGQVAAQQLGLELGRLSQEILRRGIDRPPTLTLSAGQRLSLLVSRDLVFPEGRLP